MNHRPKTKKKNYGCHKFGLLHEIKSPLSLLLFLLRVFFLRHHRNHHQLERQFGRCQTQIEFERPKTVEYIYIL